MVFNFFAFACLFAFGACMPQVPDDDTPVHCGTITLLEVENTVTEIVGTKNGLCNVVNDGIGNLTLNGNSQCHTMFMFEDDACESGVAFAPFLPDFFENRTLDPNKGVDDPLRSYIVSIVA
ncbi:hypothetical protein K491DRAFT_718744 [Lophiostoma macrostomum CBS 122681]|uniref:Uncharacterized protein n=1 Tax=Lophiostoma macrostomum CBS 122681 TaxID=1314788 RepID=A0A6A6SYF4_9PLEO|nr:hypothetical protein K491DRAFT_718744 [Lophiostoma macrostomum CBS 122681]